MASAGVDVTAQAGDRATEIRESEHIASGIPGLHSPVRHGSRWRTESVGTFGTTNVHEVGACERNCRRPSRAPKLTGSA